MIPNIPLLKTPIKYSGISVSSYNPYNLILRINGRQQDDPTFENLIEYNATLIHEWTHWIQHNGTTFGAFLNALRYTQEQTTLTSLRELPPTIAKGLIEARSKTPIVYIDPKTGQFKQQKFSNRSDYLNLFGQIWFDIQWIQSFLNDSNIESTTGVPSPQIFGDSIGDIFLYYFSNVNRNHNEVFDVRKWYKFEDKIKIVRFSGVHLTSHLLMECAATISEIQLLQNNLTTALSSYVTNEHFSKRIKLLIDTRYGIPLKLFLQLLDLDLLDIGKVCSTLNLAIFVALNPPLPPFIISPPKHKNSWSWEDIYPPLRFIKAVEAVRKVGFVKLSPNHEETYEYLQKIIEVSKLPTIIEDSFSEHSTSRGINFSDDSLSYNPENISFDSYDYISWVQKEFSALRKHSFPFITNFANCLVGDFSSKYVELLIPGETVSFSKSPIIWQSDDKLGFCYNDGFCNSLLRQVCVGYSLFDLVVGKGEYDLNEFSPEVSSSEQYKKFLNRNINYAILEVRNT